MASEPRSEQARRSEFSHRKPGSGRAATRRPVDFSTT